MCNEILPENVNLLLDDFERALCLPIILGVIYFTAILSIPLATSIYNTVQGYLNSGNSRKSNCKSMSFVNRIKGMMGLPLFSHSPSSLYGKQKSSDSETWSPTTRISDEYDCDDEYDE